MADTPTHRPRTALVLSGGGTRGAYEVGVVEGIVEALDRPRGAPPLFDLYTGSSVGAINATYLASHAHHCDMAIGGLRWLWANLTLRQHARPVWRPWAQHAVLDVNPLVELVQRHANWEELRANVSADRVHALIVTALHVRTGRTVLFADLAPGAEFVPSRDPRRVVQRTAITADHVLASSALPMVFPPRRVGEGLYYDGGLRFNTPMAPAIRAGAERLVVVTPQYLPASPAPWLDETEARAPDAMFLAGKMIDALLLDPVSYDLQVLERFNKVLDMLHDVFTDEELEAFDTHTAELRGRPYRTLDVLAVAPSQDIGACAVEYLRANRRRMKREGVVGWLLSRLAGPPEDEGSDLPSYLLFDGGWCEELMAMGRRDALARADEIRGFFAESAN